MMDSAKARVEPMGHGMRVRCFGATACVLLVALIAWVPVEARADEARRSILVTPVHVAGEIAPAIPGYVELLRRRLASSGFQVEDGEETRSWRTESPHPVTSERALARAVEMRRTHALILDFRRRGLELELSMRVYDVQKRRLAALGRARGPAHRLGALGEEALARVAAALGLSLPPPKPQRNGTAAAKPADAATREAKPGDAEAADAKAGSGNSKTQDSKTQDSKTADSRTADSKSDGSKPGDSKSADAKSADAKSADGETADSGPPLALYSDATKLVEAIDAKRFAEAWQRSQKRDEFRVFQNEIRNRAKGPGVPYAERVRLLATMGDSDTAWDMIFARAEAQLISSRADPDVMITAGEVQIGRGELSQAQEFLERAVEMAPESAEAHEVLGRLQVLQDDSESARKSFEKSISIEPSTDRLEELAKLVPETEERARLMFEAGLEAGSELQLEAASDFFVRAGKLSPEMRSAALDAEADMLLRVSDYGAARKAADLAIQAGGETSDRLLWIGESAKGEGDAKAAETAYRGALELEPDDRAALRGLGTLEVASGRVDAGLAHIGRAVELAPKDADALRELARAHATKGDSERALELYGQVEELSAAEASDLLERAEIQRKLGRTDQALVTLERAAELEPGDAEIYQSLADVHREAGNEAEAAKYDSFVLTFAGVHFKKMMGDEFAGKPESQVSSSIAALADSFLAAAPEARSVMVLPIYEEQERLEQILDWVRPKVPDKAKLAEAIGASLGRRVQVVPTQQPEGYYATLIQGYLRFEDPGSRNPSSVSMLNSIYQTDALLLARMERRPSADPNAPPGCGIDAYYVIEARLLSGNQAENARILGNSACIPNAAELYATWNPKAISLAVGLLLLLIFPFVRGWGHVRIEFLLPPKTRPLFSVRISRRRPKIEEDAPTNDERWKLREKLQSLNKNEKRLVEGNVVEFRWIAARRKPFHITVRGPLNDHQTGDLIGTFNAEQQVEIKRGKTTEIQFDMCPKQACIEVRVVSGGSLVPDARVGLRGDARSIRFTRGKPAHIYLDPGSYVLVAGAGTVVAEKVLHVPDRDPMHFTLDLSEDEAQVFEDCADAVTPYLEGHFEGAAQALEAQNLAKRASQVRALAELPPRDATLVRSLLVDRDGDGNYSRVRLDDANDTRAASALREAGRHTEAAQQFESQGDLRQAALTYESVYDWANAAECYRRLEDAEGLLDVLEKAGEAYEAAEVAVQLEEMDRALSNLKRVDRRDVHYAEACLMMGQLLAERGDGDLAVEKMEEALALSSAENVPLSIHEQYAGLLVAAGRIDEAIEVYRTIRRIDHDYPGAKERIEELQALLTQVETQMMSASGATMVGTPNAGMSGTAPAVESRYEIVSELGRGAMGIVYKARDTVLGRMVALKKLPENMREHELAIEYFLREARSAAALNHPNIVTIFDAGQEGGTYFITMECLEGTPLDAVLKRVGKLSPRDTSILGTQAATGLAYAHSQRIIHRDIKASNLFYTKDRVVKVMDFGLAKAVEEVRKQASVIAGTPYYMPPEQAIGGIVDHRSDLYSLGVTLFQFCTGGVPFQQGDVTYHHAHTPPPDPRERVPEIPETLALLILELMAKDPDARVQSADEVVQRLRTVVAELAR